MIETVVFPVISKFRLVSQLAQTGTHLDLVFPITKWIGSFNTMHQQVRAEITTPVLPIPALTWRKNACRLLVFLPAYGSSASILAQHQP